MSQDAKAPQVPQQGQEGLVQGKGQVIPVIKMVGMHPITREKSLILHALLERNSLVETLKKMDENPDLGSVIIPIPVQIMSPKGDRVLLEVFDSTKVPLEQTHFGETLKQAQAAQEKKIIVPGQ